ncbi:MAG: phosphoribosylamine--glycine ligase [Planctomycetes bacterium]|nr:phosphoribosylamine--glycine ligase [Planctomycetota bacterium]
MEGASLDDSRRDAFEPHERDPGDPLESIRASRGVHIRGQHVGSRTKLGRYKTVNCFSGAFAVICLLVGALCIAGCASTPTQEALQFDPVPVAEVGADDIDGMLAACAEHAIDFVVVGPEAPLCAGLADRLEAAGVATFGPSAAAARLEGSKGFANDLCAKYGIPTAAYARFTDAQAAKAYIAAQGAPIVVKADGLAAGKGVVVAETVEAACDAVDALISGFGAAAAELVIEECLTGEEASFFALVDGETALPLAAAQDHKRVGEGDTGPNTGGMGAYSPAPIATPEVLRIVERDVFVPIVDAMRNDGAEYKGLLYCGIMLTPGGVKVLEFNCRFGDPETQVIIPRLASDLFDMLEAVVDGRLADIDIHWTPRPAVCVVMASGGYPGTYEKGKVIEGLNEAATVPDAIVFHAGTRSLENLTVTNGGRVLGVTATGETIADAQRRAYDAVKKIRFESALYRSDIGFRAISAESRT